MGTYGSPFDARSVRNQDGAYGTQLGDRSVLDMDASDLPLIDIAGQAAERMSLSSLFTNIVGPGDLLEFLGCGIGP